MGVGRRRSIVERVNRRRLPVSSFFAFRLSLAHLLLFLANLHPRSPSRLHARLVRNLLSVHHLATPLPSRQLPPCLALILTCASLSNVVGPTRLEQPCEPPKHSVWPLRWLLLLMLSPISRERSAATRREKRARCMKRAPSPALVVGLVQVARRDGVDVLPVLERGRGTRLARLSDVLDVLVRLARRSDLTPAELGRASSAL